MALAIKANYTEDDKPCRLPAYYDMKLGDVKKMFLEKLYEYYGYEYSLCKDIHISHLTFNKWCENDPEFKQSVEDIKKQFIDEAALKVWQHINNGSEKMLKFFLERKGGWTQQQNINVNTDGEGFKLNFGNNDEDN